MFKMLTNNNTPNGSRKAHSNDPIIYKIVFRVIFRPIWTWFCRILIKEDKY